MPEATTRDRILDASLRLFNEDGVAKVSTNRIAAETGISPGNLYYHFKSKGQLIEWLDRRFERRLEPLVRSAPTITALDDCWLALHLAFEAVYEHRFLCLDVDYLVRESPGYAARARRRTAEAMVAARRLCQNLAGAGVLRAAPADLELLAFHLVFTASCWLSFTRVVPDARYDAAGSGLAAYYVLSLFGPYLSEDSRPYLDYLRSKYVKPLEQPKPARPAGRAGVGRPAGD